MADAPPRLHIVFQNYNPPLYFVTFNTHRRRRLLANERVHRQLIEFALKGEQRGIAVGRFVVMPDHVHLFVRNNSELTVSQWVRLMKRHLSRRQFRRRGRIGRRFFDHLIRHRESYSPKWEYVRMNPVRAGLIRDSDEWPWQGEIARLEAL